MSRATKTKMSGFFDDSKIGAEDKMQYCAAPIFARERLAERGEAAPENAAVTAEMQSDMNGYRFMAALDRSGYELTSKS